MGDQAAPAPPSGGMSIWVRYRDGRLTDCTVASDASVRDVLHQLHCGYGHTLQLGGALLHRRALLSDCGICAEATVSLQRTPTLTVDDWKNLFPADPALLDLDEIAWSNPPHIDTPL